MKFELYIDAVCEDIVKFNEILQSDPLISKKFQDDIGRVDKVFVEKDMDIIQRLIELGVKHNIGYDIQFYSKFTKKELDSCSLFRINGKKFINEDDASFNKMLDYSRALEVEARKHPFGYRKNNYSKYYLKKVQKLKKESFATPPGGGQFLCTSYLADLMKKEGISGWSKMPVLHPITEEKNSELFMLRIYNELPSIEKKEPFVTENDYGYCLNSLLMLNHSESNIEHASDFYVTKENLTGDFSGLCCVSKSFYDFYNDHKLKGLGFSPALVKGTSLCDQYIEQWYYMEELFKSVNSISIKESW